MREVMNVFLNEWMKIIRRRRFLVTAILSVMLVGLFGVVTYHEYHNELRYSPIASAQSQIDYLNQEISRVERTPQNTARDQQLTSLKQALSAEQGTLKQLTAATNGDWRENARHQIATLQQQITALQHSVDTADKSQVGSMQASIKQLQYSLDHNVAPLSWPNYTAYTSLAGFLQIAASIFLPLLVVILVADMVAGEATDGTIKLLLVRPVSRAKILMGKWLVSVVSTAIWTVAVFAALLGTAVAITGTRGGTQPVLTNIRYTFEQVVDAQGVPQPGQFSAVPHYDHAGVLPQWEFLLMGLLFTIFAMVIVASITFLCSTLFKSAMVSTASAMGSIVIGFMVVNMARHETWAKWVFSTHLDLLRNWNGQLSMQMNQSVSVTGGILVLLVWALVAMVVSFVSFTRRDVLNA